MRVKYQLFCVFKYFLRDLSNIQHFVTWLIDFHSVCVLLFLYTLITLVLVFTHFTHFLFTYFTHFTLEARLDLFI